jgi:hypothetical protein
MDITPETFFGVVEIHPYADVEQILSILRLQGYEMERVDAPRVSGKPVAKCCDCLASVERVVHCVICNRALCDGGEKHYFVCGRGGEVLCAEHAYRLESGEFRCFMH